MNPQSKILTGDWVGSAWNSSPELTPYAQAICDNYPIQIPLFITKSVTVSGIGSSNPLPIVQTTSPFLYDSLLIGMSASLSSEADLDHIAVQITHLETGIPWAAPNSIGCILLGAIAGIDLNVMPVLKLPEAFFLPARTRLKMEWLRPFNGDTGPTTIIYTFLGIQLINHTTGFQTPSHVTMPNGQAIKVGSRLPWFASVPFGRQATRRQFGGFGLPLGQQALQFLPPVDCDVEIHDVYTNVETSADSVPDPTLLTAKLTDMRSQGDWTPGLTPVTAVFGNETQGYPALPFTEPHIMHMGHRTQMTAQNNDTSFGLSGGIVTFRGVRRCEY
jgi:hypothetical protein